MPAGGPSRVKGEERRNKEATWHHHITRPCTWLCSIPQDSTHSFTHAHRASHATDTHPHTLSVKQNTKQRSTLTETSAFDISQNSRILAVPKPKRPFMAEMFNIYINNAPLNISWTVLRAGAVGTDWFGSTAANIKLINSTKRTGGRKTERNRTGGQTDRRACSKLNDNQLQQRWREKKLSLSQSKQWLHPLCWHVMHTRTHIHTHTRAHSH